MAYNVVAALRGGGLPTLTTRATNRENSKKLSTRGTPAILQNRPLCVSGCLPTALSYETRKPYYSYQIPMTCQ
ncbi:MAG: hypothetical protein LBI45_05875 [Bacteroidales bacterium]|nr:hypothetical protein [Bacteroidales bacterium]